MPDRGKPTGPRAAKRGVWYFMRTILMLTALAALVYGVFATAMNATNLYILVTEGLQLRAECVLQDGADAELPEYFTDAFLKKDALLASTKYQDYTITNFDYRISVEGFSCWPWSKAATMTVTERMVTLGGTLLDEKKPENPPQGATYPPPEWESGRYRVYFSKRGGRWYIYQMVLLEAAPSEAPKRTPNMSVSPRPAYTTPPPAATKTPATPSPSPSLPPTPSPSPAE